MLSAKDSLCRNRSREKGLSDDLRKLMRIVQIDVCVNFTPLQSNGMQIQIIIHI
jgi:hypothetical protein